MPIDTIKIDRSFISQLPGDNGDVAIVNAIVTLGRILGRSITAEGVEAAAQLRLLADIGCDYLQGFMFSHPADSADLAQLLAHMKLPAIAVSSTPRVVSAAPTRLTARALRRVRGV